MIVGVPAETKEGEHRVAMTPDGVRELTAHGHTVVIESGAGEGSSIADDTYTRAGATVADADAAWAAELVVKVKEPQPAETPRLRKDLVLFTYLHLAAYPEVADALLAAGATAIAYETVQVDSGALPLLAPMSEVAGRLASQIGAHYLERDAGGRGVLLGGAPGVEPARVVVLGAGNAGWNAAWIAQGMESEVLLLDKDIDRLRVVDQIHKGRIVTMASNRGAVERAVREADLVIGAVLVPGGRAPTVVTEEMVRGMKTGSVIVDVIHYAVGNIPAAVPNTSTYALTNSTLPYVLTLAELGVAQAVRADRALARGVNAVAGKITNSAAAAALGREAVDPVEVLS
jgi:alanine dehydrogenase